jgi:uncharacterized membrane protein
MPDEVLRERGWARLRWWALVLAGLVQLVVLYGPASPGSLPFPGADKVVHTAVFAAPVVAGLAARVRAGFVLGVSAVHAVTSEIVQATLLAARSGEGADVIADLAGVAAGWALYRLVVGRGGGSRQAGRIHS